MKLTLPYSVRSFFELPLLNYKPVLSPYDFESVILAGLALHPRITLRGVEEGVFRDRVGGCSNPVFINRDKYVCEALAGFPHWKRGVAVVKTVRGVRLEAGNGLVLEGEEASYSSTPGALVAAIYDGSYAHVVAASYDSIEVFERAYRKKPLKTSIGYRSFAITYSDGRSQVLTGEGITEVGFPVDALAALEDSVLVKSSGWIVRLGPDMPRPVTIAVEACFTGLHQLLPVFRVGGRLYRLEGGALTPIEYVKSFPEESAVTASHTIVIDYGRELTAYDVSGRKFLQTPKSEEAACWSIECRVFCCSRGLCGVVEPGEASVFIEPLSEVYGGTHVVRMSSEAPLIAHYSGKQVRVYPGMSIDIVGVEASALSTHVFNIDVWHLLGSASTSINSPPAKVSLKAKARAYVSSGIHECGGLSLVELDVVELTAPRGVKVLIEGSEVKPGERKSMCVDRVPDSLRVVAVDAVAKDSKELDEVSVEKTYVPAPSLDISIKHEEDYSIITIATDAERARAKLFCKNKSVELTVPSSIVSDCILPAYISVELSNRGFTYHCRRDVVLRGLLDYALSNIRSGLKEYREGGFIARYVVPAIPNANPLSSFKIKAGSNTEILFKSKQAGRLLVASQSSVKGFIVKPGGNRVIAPFSSTYYLVFDGGFSKYVYKLELPLAEQVRAAEQQAQALYRALERWLK